MLTHGPFFASVCTRLCQYVIWGFGNGLKKRRKTKTQVAQNPESIEPQGFPVCIFFGNKRQKTCLHRRQVFYYQIRIRTGAGVNDVPVARQSRDPACPAGQVESLTACQKTCLHRRQVFLLSNPDSNGSEPARKKRPGLISGRGAAFTAVSCWGLSLRGSRRRS